MSNRILIVDHDVQAGRDLATLLAAMGYQVQCAFNGIAAIDQINRTSVDLVILNAHMPHGWQVLKSVRVRYGTDELPVVVNSVASDQVWQMARSLGANELWNRQACSFDEICRSLEQYLSVSSMAMAA